MGIPHPSAKGGPPIHLPYLVEYFKNRPGYKIKTFYYGSIQGDRESAIKKIFYTILKIIEFLYDIFFYRPDIVHLNTAFGSKSLLRDVPFSLLSFIFRKNLLFKIHGSHLNLLMTKNKYRLVLIKLFFLGAKKIGVLSEREKQEFITQFGHKNKMIVVKNIVKDMTREKEERIYLKKKKTTVFGLFVSRIERDKGLDDLISALPEIINKIPNFKLLIVGDGIEKENCVNLAKQNLANNFIDWLGYLNRGELNKIYEIADLFIFPTHLPEGMPMVLLEAMKYRIPILTTKVRFAESYFKEFENCIYIEKGNIKDIAKKIIVLFLDKQLQLTIIENNFRFIKNFSPEKVGLEFEDIYWEMLNYKKAKIKTSIEKNRLF